MKNIEKRRFYKLHMLRNRIRHGLFLFTLRNFIPRLGLDIDPYYWESEGLNHCEELIIKGSPSDYEVVNIYSNEVDIMHNIMGLDSRKLKEDIRNGELCLGLKYGDKIVAVVFAKFNEIIYKRRIFKLKSNQAYIHNLYTFTDYRGKNLAPYLRYQCYVTLRERGVDEIFSITSYFNTSSLRANKKMNIKHSKLFFHFGLFKRFHWDVLLKKF